MTDTEAEAMLLELVKHYKQPVMPVKRYCDALENWARAIQTNCKRPEGEHGPHDRVNSRHGAYYVEHLHHILIDIHKSALLYRLIYVGEKFRTTQCPMHRGKLSMDEWIGGGEGEKCPHGCQGTGWLPFVECGCVVKTTLYFEGKPVEHHELNCPLFKTNKITGGALPMTKVEPSDVIISTIRCTCAQTPHNPACAIVCDNDFKFGR